MTNSAAIPKWEYKFEPRRRIDQGVVTHIPDLIAKLDEHGAIGWELVAIDYGGFLFKRQVVDE